MRTHAPGLLSNLISLILLAGAALWSIMQMVAWIISSIVGYILVAFDACRSIALKKPQQDREVMYNLMNYPDEISSDS